MTKRGTERWNEAQLGAYRTRFSHGMERVNTDQAGKADDGVGVGLLLARAQPDAASTGPLYAMVALCRAHKLPEPIPEFQFHPTRRWRFDYAWPMRMLALEVEGGIWTQGRHTRGAGAIADLEKYSEAAIAGWRVIYCTPGDIGSTGIERARRALG